MTNKVKQIPLIKINQSNGNSFQIHIKENEKDKRWKPKMESWHYLENGLATLGLKRNINIKEYKNACLIINNQMQLLSKQIVGKEISLEIGKDRAKEFIKKVNPWQYVNLVVIKKDQVVDSGDGGIQHSWEEDLEKFPYGNVLYEVQQDVMDPISTIRCFDKGKFKKDGSIREIHIEDYFKYIDSVNEDNDINKMLLINKEKRLISKKYYSLDKLEIEKEIIDNTNNSFVHLFVREGKVEIIAENGKVILSKGHSCFIPEFVKSYKIRALNNKSIILKTTV